MSGVNTDVVPFVMATGRWVSLAGINVVGLKRRGFERPTIHALRKAYRLFFYSEGTRAERLALIEKSFGDVAAVGEFVSFIRESGNRPLALPRKNGEAEEGDGGDGA